MAASVGEIPAFVMLATRRLFGKEPVMAEKHHLDMVKSHIGPVPVIPVPCRGFDTFRRAGRLEGVVGRKMRLSEIGGIIAGRRQRSGKSLVAGLGRQVDSIVMYAVRPRRSACQDRGTRRPADHAGRYGVGKACAVTRQLIGMRCFDLAPFDAKAVGPMLIGGDE